MLLARSSPKTQIYWPGNETWPPCSAQKHYQALQETKVLNNHFSAVFGLEYEGALVTVSMHTRTRDVGPFHGIHRDGAWKAIGDRLLKPCYLSGVDHNRKISTGKQRTDVGKYSFVNKRVQKWNQLPAGLLASLLCSLSTFRNRVKKTVTSK